MGLKSKRCSECVRKGYSKCDVTLSYPQWVKAKEVRERLQKELEAVEVEEVELLQRLVGRRQKKIRLRKQLRLAERKTDDAVAKEVEDADTADAVEDILFGSEEGIEIPPLPSFHDNVEKGIDEWSSFFPLDWPVQEVPESPPAGPSTAVL